MTKDHEQWYWYGVMHGFGTAQVIGDRAESWPSARREISEQIRRIERHTEGLERRTKSRRVIDGDAEYQSWMKEAGNA